MLGTSDLVNSFIEDFLNFLIHLSCINDKKLICPFEYEGVITAFVTTPVEDDKIRVSVFRNGALYKKYRPEYKFDADIIIKKDTFIRQMYEILQNIVSDTLKDNEIQNQMYEIFHDTLKGNEKLSNQWLNKVYYWIDRINYTIGELDKYFENPENFINDYEFKRYIRVFDVAYKTLENKWKFKVFLEEDEEAKSMYWEKMKQEGRILDFDIFEQAPEQLFGWNEENKEMERLTEEKIQEKLKPDLSKRVKDNWVYSTETKKWYSKNEIMPYFKSQQFCLIHNYLRYEVSLDYDASENKDFKYQEYVRDSYDIDGEMTKDNLGYLYCVLKLFCGSSDFAEIEFNYRNYKQIREGLEKALNGEYARFDLGDHRQCKLHLWQHLYANSESTEERDLIVACYSSPDNYCEGKELYSFLVNKKEFIECFNKAIDEIEHKIETTKYLMEVGKNLKIEEKFKLSEKGYKEEFNYIEEFKGDYACVYKEGYGWGIINKKFEWVIKPESVTMYGDGDSKYGRQLLGWFLKYYYLHNINGKLFIAAKKDRKQFVIDINGDIKILHTSDNAYYSYLNEELYFVFADEDKTIITNSKGEDILSFDFEVGEKFWLFDDIIIVSKDKKFGIVDWKGNIIIDFIFSDITPDKDNLDLIPVKYIDKWGFINKNGEVLDLKIKDI